MTTADAPNATSATPLCDHLRRSGEWNPNWTPFAELDPEWTERFMAVTESGALRATLSAKAMVKALSSAAGTIRVSSESPVSVRTAKRSAMSGT